MGLFDWLGNVFDDANGFSSITTSCFTESSDWSDDSTTNPANGLTMIGGCSGIDVAGNSYGFDSAHDNFDTASSSIGSSFDSWTD